MVLSLTDTYKILTLSEVLKCSLQIDRGTQRQFSENMCSEDDLRSRIFGTYVVKIPCLSACPRIFEHLTDFYPKRVS